MCSINWGGKWRRCSINWGGEWGRCSINWGVEWGRCSINWGEEWGRCSINWGGEWGSHKTASINSNFWRPRIQSRGKMEVYLFTSLVQCIAAGQNQPTKQQNPWRCITFQIDSLKVCYVSDRFVPQPTKQHSLKVHYLSDTFLPQPTKQHSLMVNYLLDRFLPQPTKQHSLKVLYLSDRFLSAWCPQPSSRWEATQAHQSLSQQKHTTWNTKNTGP